VHSSKLLIVSWIIPRVLSVYKSFGLSDILLHTNKTFAYLSTFRLLLYRKSNRYISYMSSILKKIFYIYFRFFYFVFINTLCVCGRLRRYLKTKFNYSNDRIWRITKSHTLQADKIDCFWFQTTSYSSTKVSTWLFLLIGKRRRMYFWISQYITVKLRI